MSARWDLFRYSLPLREPLRFTGRELATREGLLLRLSDGAGAFGWGEIAPLPGLHPETLREAEAALLRALTFQPPMADDGKAVLADAECPATVRFGIDTALLRLRAHREGCALAEMLGAHPRPYLTLNGLLSGDAATVRRQLDHLLAQGITAVKLKVGRRSLDADVAAVRAVRAALPDGALLRLDANRAWSMASALAFARAIAGTAIDYIEEPLRDAAQLPEFAARTGLAVALDETLDERPAEDLHPFPGLAALVLKPSVLGGLRRTGALVARLAPHGVRAVVSCAVQSGVGHAAVAALGAVLNDRDVPAGLGTFRWLASDVVDPAFSAPGGRVDIRAVEAAVTALDPRPLTAVAGGGLL